MAWIFKSVLALAAIERVFAVDNPLKMAEQFLPKDVLLAAASLSPPNSPQICKSLWTADGWVCKSDQIVKFAEKDREKLKAAETEFIQTLDSFKNLENLFLQKVPKFNGSNLQTQFLTRLNDFEVNEAKEGATTCWSYMGKLRNSSLCFVCSARNYKYYLDLKGLISMDECRRLIQQCDIHFIKMAKLNRFIVERISGFIRSDLADPAFASSLTKTFNTSSASQFLDFYFQAAANPIEDVQAKAKICEWSLKLLGTPVLHEFTKGFKKIIDLVTEYLNKPKSQTTTTNSTTTAPLVPTNSSSSSAGTLTSPNCTNPAGSTKPASSSNKKTKPARKLLRNNWEARSLQNENALSNGVLVTIFDDSQLELANGMSDQSVMAQLINKTLLNLSLIFP